ncbi:MAG TPA: glycosyltransferase family 9 protein [Candidatus Acidoferrales bacterium]|nr:glycosyltransferase family 9 protein [Candidatus Acidoferrales bacterium]
MTAPPIHIRPGRGILIVDSQGLGDVVQSLPLLKAVCGWASGRWPVRVLFASAQHYELVREERMQLIPLFVHHLRDDPRGLVRLWLQIACKSDLIVCAPEMSAAKLVLLKLMTGAPYAVGEASAPYSWFLTHSVTKSWTAPFLETQDKIISFLGVTTPLGPPVIHLRPDESTWAESELSREAVGKNQPVLGIQCSSIVPSKRWPAHNYGALVRILMKRFPELAVISFGSESERASSECARTLAEGVPWLEATGKWTIRKTLAMLRMCDLFISGDTGLMHMAAAVGTRTIGIFGPTSTTRRAPLHNGGIALSPNRACHPCFRGHWTPCDCICSIAPDQVALATEQSLEAHAPVALTN